MLDNKVIAKEYVEKSYIHKDKIREKIKEIIKNNPANDEWEEGEDFIVTSDEDYVIEVLGGLIQEEW